MGQPCRGTLQPHLRLLLSCYWLMSLQVLGRAWLVKLAIEGAWAAGCLVRWRICRVSHDVGGILAVHGKVVPV